ncbi:signal transduction histidine kinase [Phyllobacterium myrsinacearum]|uniref:sensor histidine kinase n=1 Tax=Phyllobacterium myrsinacearum TaxID=28101 RepID=UPI0010296130|nr:HAMP domain-containing sensor histidine kinase [Phyllobacterium myrsinacearum]RZS79690.1 signal transduction histidine kinase [Phyllobacterium myrsinacearum]
MRFFRKRSLKRRLIWQLLFLQSAILIAVVVALIMLLVRADLGGKFMDTDGVDVIGAAIERQPDGKLVVTDTADVLALKQTSPNIWFIARNKAGEVITGGAVPETYRPFAAVLDRLSYGEMRDTVEPYNLAVVVRTVSTDIGDFTILAGNGSMVSTLFVIVLLSHLFMVPILLLLTLVALIAIPIIVSRALSGIATVAARAEQIDIDRRGTRLPEDKIPVEVQPMVKAINGALGRLDDGYQRHQRFLIDAAHELRTPIAILQTRLETMPPGALRTRLLLDANRVAGLAEQMLDLQRINQPGETFHDVNLVELCQRVAADLAPIAITAGYELSLETTERRVIVRGDSGALGRAVTNLVQNAIEHGEHRGAIIIRVEQDGTVEVADEGPGIPSAERALIFEPFYRLHPRERGAGLGLNLVREIVTRHQGHVAVVEEETAGACFRITLPLAPKG